MKKTQTYAATPAERKRKHRERLVASGLKQFECWVPPHCGPRLKEYVKKLQKEVES